MSWKVTWPVSFVFGIFSIWDGLEIFKMRLYLIKCGLAIWPSIWWKRFTYCHFSVSMALLRIKGSKIWNVPCSVSELKRTVASSKFLPNIVDWRFMKLFNWHGSVHQGSPRRQCTDPRTIFIFLALGANLGQHLDHNLFNEAAKIKARCFPQWFKPGVRCKMYKDQSPNCHRGR